MSEILLKIIKVRMKRILLLCLSMILLVSVAASCAKNDSNESSQWDFAYTIEKKSFMQGETVCITIDVTNIGKAYEFIGSTVDLFGPAKLYLNSDENQTIESLPFANTCDATKRVFKNGEKAQHTYYFYIDENSPEGLYTFSVPFGGESKIFKSILVVNAPLTDEELAIIEFADTFITKEYPSLALENCRADINQNAKGEYSVEYTLTISGYRTYECYHVNFNADKTVRNFYANYEGKFSAYLPYATDDKISAAEEKLTNQLEKYETRSGFYLSIDDQGYLCLNAEVIVDSLFNDHEHKFFTERICGLQ